MRNCYILIETRNNLPTVTCHKTLDEARDIMYERAGRQYEKTAEMLKLTDTWPEILEGVKTGTMRAQGSIGYNANGCIVRQTACQIDRPMNQGNYPRMKFNWDIFAINENALNGEPLRQVHMEDDT